MMKTIFTSESVTEGHPDKMCDLISDAILDAMLVQDPNSRVACEASATFGLIHIMGEIVTKAQVDIEQLVRKTILEIGYDKDEYGFNGNTCSIIRTLHAQSSDIAMGVDRSFESKNGGFENQIDLGAGDQGIMFGFACSDTKEYMPLSVHLAHLLTKKLANVRKDNSLNYLRPDGKSQVSVQYENGKPLRVDTIIIAAQHRPDISQWRIRRDIIDKVIKPVIPNHLLDKNTKFLINTTGRFVIGGPQGDAGLTGRKIIVDTYGGYARHGGGAFSGKDATKMDRTGSYAARYIAKNIVASGLASVCEIQLAYAIGVSKPISIYVNTNNTGKIGDEKIAEAIEKFTDLRPIALINRFELRRPIYKQTASYGHFGRNDLDLPWEKTDLVEVFKNII